MSDQSKSESNEQWLARLLGTDFLLWSPTIQTEDFRSGIGSLRHTASRALR